MYQRKNSPRYSYFGNQFYPFEFPRRKSNDFWCMYSPREEDRGNEWTPRATKSTYTADIRWRNGLGGVSKGYWLYSANNNLLQDALSADARTEHETAYLHDSKFTISHPYVYIQFTHAMITVLEQRPLAAGVGQTYKLECLAVDVCCYGHNFILVGSARPSACWSIHELLIHGPNCLYSNYHVNSIGNDQNLRSPS